MNVYVKLSNVMLGFPEDQPAELPVVEALVAAHKSMLTERDCEVALICGLLPEPAEVIAERAGLDPVAFEEELLTASRHGVVMCEYINEEKTKIGYYRAGILPGIAETYTAQTCTPESAYWYDTFCGGQMAESMPNMAYGRGGMRVIPVREAVDNPTEVLKYDELKAYLDAVDTYSVANCACKNARKTLGQGCGHPTEVCVQLGKTAESFIISGLGRQITREEAEAIFKDSERRGLVHQVTVAEAGKSIMICNCCACSCIILRAANMLNLAQPSRSNYKPVVDEEKCVGCGACVDNCSMNAMRLGSKHAKDAPVLLDLPDPFYTDWTEKYWDLDSTNRKLVTS